MKTSNILQVVGVSLFSLLIVGMLIWLIVTHEVRGGADESGFVSVCWQSSGMADFRTESCSQPQEITWENTPLIVRDISENSQFTEQAINFYNSEVGCSLFQLNNETDSWNVLVSRNVPVTVGVDHFGGATSFRRDTLRRQRAYVDIFSSPHNETIMNRVYQHEFGHVLGLAHDEWNGSIMRRAQNGEIESVRLSDYDSMILRNRYCN